MKFVIRTDAAQHIGTGHVMRCLTLAKALQEKGHLVSFVSRAFEGNLIGLVREEGFKVHELPNESNATLIANDLPHDQWLLVTEEEDFRQCSSYLKDEQSDWVIVDHYALSEIWEKQARKFCKNIMVIDDLADRDHDCDLLLDQNYGSEPESYSERVPGNCQLLLGTKYALLRDEFSEWREYSLSRRKQNDYALNHILVNLGGIDKDNYTLAILCSLESILTTQTVTVVMGASAPHVESIRAYARTSTYTCKVQVGVNNMAELMANADLAIGAAGSTTWERCTLGVPSVLVILAENQKLVALDLEKANVISLVYSTSLIEDELQRFFFKIEDDNQILRRLSNKSNLICDGLGVNKVISLIMENSKWH